MPGWLRDTASRLTPVAGRASQMIEERVMAEIAESLREEAADKSKPPKRKPSKRLPPASDAAARSVRGSVADEISKLKALRDNGTLTEEQYARALDRALGS
jgi:hypothetical protein